MRIFASKKRVFLNILLGWLTATGDYAHVYFPARRCAHILGWWGRKADRVLISTKAVTIRGGKKERVPRGAQIDEIELSRLVFKARDEGGLRGRRACLLYNWVYDVILPGMTLMVTEG